MSNSTQLEASYENVSANCPACGHRNLLNRATDIGHLAPVANAQVTCGACGAPFTIHGDLVNPGHEMLLLGAWEYVKKKEYGHAVLTATTGYERFFAHFLRVELLYRPSRRDRTGGCDDLAWLNSTRVRLDDGIQRFTFRPMRNLFLCVAVDGVRPATRVQASEHIDLLLQQTSTSVPRARIEAVGDEPLRDLLLKVADTRIDELRNAVVHKTALRPKEDAAVAAVKDAIDTVFALSRRFDLHDDNYHLNEPRERVDR